MKKYPLTRNSLLPAIAFALLILPGSASAADQTQHFDKILKQEGITFHVTCPNDSSLGKVTIVPGGLEIDNAVITKEVDGTVYDAEIADLNTDGSPELYVYVASAGSGSYGSLVAYSANNKKSLSEIYLQPLENDELNAKGYMGHDIFSVTDKHLVRSFPVYKDLDTNAHPTGGTRKLEYKLVKGEAGWQLVLEKSSLQ